MNEELLKKLRFKSGQASAVLNAPDGYSLGVEAGSDGKHDFVQLFVNSKAELEDKLPEVLPLLAEDAVFWITYPKQSGKIKPDINRDSLASHVQDTTPYRAVSNVAVDEKWSALRFRLKEKVNAKKS
ncbi:hypothetical protein [Paenibacillus glycanilyticus]|uniref:DUF3052 domain-containing protein n=1 Tax=Paenibacillus glycanilyticus TaxID=126569 RepID=A0ABQ6GE86_9BACL|nr:hypothetical protein [Paenibacillus glycanilyticus]GLX68805.1 hypothetical protein MU1_31500 [Paenibacillus glycanilyticus]